jgi:hypothetical protein
VPNPLKLADDLPPPLSASLTTQFLRAFNPAESARPLIPRLRLPRTLVLSVDLSKFHARPSIARVLLNYVFVERQHYFT